MAFSDEPRGADAPRGETAQEAAHEPHLSDLPVNGENHSYSDSWSSAGPLDSAALEQTAAPEQIATSAAVVETAKPSSRGGAGSPPKPPDPPDEDDEEDGMARMSFLEHLEELRKRLLLAIGGIGVAFFLCLFFSDQLWNIVRQPAKAALTHLGVNPPDLILINPMDTFQIIWMKLPILAAVFLSSPWILYQVWAFIAPGLYKRERRWAAPFVISSAGLFILGGVFAYFIAFRYGLEFLLGLGMPQGIRPGVNVSEYYDLFVDVMLGVGIVFEIPVLLFLLTLIHVASPAFLIRHSRYAILVIVILAAVITPTGDVFNLALFATPMIILFYIGIFASYILVLHREKRRFPWGTFFKWFLIGLVVLAVAAWGASVYYGYHFTYRWPFFVR
jgi:sec-independent protein translocase protein TatC